MLCDGQGHQVQNSRHHAYGQESHRKRAEREASEQRRALILLAARNCLSEQGMRGFTLKNIAEEAKVSISLLSHNFGSVEELLKSVFRSVLFEARPGDYTKPRNLAEAPSNLEALVAKNFDPDYYSRRNLLVWFPIYEEMLLNPRTRRTLDKIEQELTAEVTRAVGAVAEFRKLELDAASLAHEFLAFLDGLWLRWCLSDRRDTGRERTAAIGFLGATLGSVERG
jgi:TetR/AcrR family transcriptional repressor of bet genes